MTREDRQKGDREMQKILEKWGLDKQERKRITEIYEREEEEARREEEHLIRHQKSPALIGMWKNSTILTLRKELVQVKNWKEEVAMKGAIELAETRMQMAEMIHKRIAKYRQALTVWPNKEEVEAYGQQWTNRGEQEKQQAVGRLQRKAEKMEKEK